MICPHCAHDNFPGSEQCENCLADLTQLDQPVAQDRVERSLLEDTVSLLKPRPALAVSPDATVKQAIDLMLAHDIGAVLIVENAGALLGIFSERDLLMKVADPRVNHTTRPVKDFMTPNPATVRPTDTLAFVLHQMDVGGYRHVPVIKDGRPPGMISVRDMLRHMTQLCKTCGL
ncbi:MAG: CBS domain-containing protein [Gemmataceae bacterium]